MKRKLLLRNLAGLTTAILATLASSPAWATPSYSNSDATFVEISGISLVTGDGTSAQSWTAELSGTSATFKIQRVDNATINSCAFTGGVDTTWSSLSTITITGSQCEVTVDLSSQTGVVNADMNVDIIFVRLLLSVTSSSSNTSEAQNPTPAKYSGPEFSGLSGMGIMTGSIGKLEGKRLDQISSIEIGGKAATFTANSATELELSLPAALAPGLYDLVINSSAGKLTHISAIQVREPKKSFSITTRSTGKISNDQYIEHSLIASMQIPELDKARCIVNASTQAMAQAMANRLCAVVKASNPNIETTIVETRSTVKGDAVYARVSYGWN